MKRWKKNLLRTSGAFLLLAIVTAWFLLPRIIVNPYRLDVSQHPNQFPGGLTPEAYGLNAEDFDIQTTDGYNLDAWLVHSRDSAHCTVILLHGIGACKELFLPTARMLSENHCNVLLFDLRAHGRSEGPCCTYGYFEKDDVKRITSKLLERDTSACIGLYGASLGGAIAYQSLANDPRLAFGIVESTFDELSHVVHAYGARFIGFECNWLADFALWRAQQMAGFDALEVKPVRSAAQISQPMLVAHGEQDENIPYAYGKRNFEAIQSQDKEFMSIPGAGHNNLGTVAGPSYVEKLLDFLSRQ